MSLYLEFDRIVRRFAVEQTQYAVAGGLAVGLHGFVRATQDMDFLIHSDDFLKAKDVLRSLGYRMNPEAQELPRAGLTLWRFYKGLKDDLMVVDLLVPRSVAMGNVLRRAIVVPFGKGSIRVVTAADLIAMKKRRSATTDKADIEVLRRQK